MAHARTHAATRWSAPALASRRVASTAEAHWPQLDLHFGPHWAWRVVLGLYTFGWAGGGPLAEGAVAYMHACVCGMKIVVMLVYERAALLC